MTQGQVFSPCRAAVAQRTKNTELKQGFFSERVQRTRSTETSQLNRQKILKQGFSPCRAAAAQRTKHRTKARFLQMKNEFNGQKTEANFLPMQSCSSSTDKKRWTEAKFLLRTSSTDKKHGSKPAQPTKNTEASQLNGQKYWSKLSPYVELQ